MNNTISNVNFSGWWTLKTAKVIRPSDKAEMTLKKFVYHPNLGESAQHTNEVMGKIPTHGLSYDSFLPPKSSILSNNGSKVKGHCDLFVTERGDTYTAEQAIKSGALTTDEAMRKMTLECPDGHSVRDNIELAPERINELVGQYFSDVV